MLGISEARASKRAGTRRVSTCAGTKEIRAAENSSKKAIGKPDHSRVVATTKDVVYSPTEVGDWGRFHC